MHRVVVTGFGAISALGLSAEETWQNLVEGRSGVGPITFFDTSDFSIKIAAEIKDFDPATVLDPREVRRQDRFEWLGNAAAQAALVHGGLEITEENSTRIGVIISSGVGGIDTLFEQSKTLLEEGPRRLSPFAIPRIMTNGAAGTVSIAHGLRGTSFSVGSACASASDGIGIAAILLRAGMADTFLVGGAEAAITPLSVGAFLRIGAYTPRDDHTPSPFSAERDGLVMGECGAVLVLESLEHAKARGAEIWGELVGYGSSADAFHITAPTEDGSGSALAIRQALESAQMNPDEIDYINAHGTGTPLNDVSETKAIKLAMGRRAYDIPVSSTKSMTGHCMGATGALEAVFCLQAIRDGIVPPTINFGTKDPECDLDYVPNEARSHPIRAAASNSFGFGGHNAVVIFKAFDG